MSNMKRTFTGRVTKILQRYVGQSDKGQYAIDTIIIEEEGEKYPEKLMGSILSTSENPRFKEWGIMEGNMVTVSYDLNVREFDRKDGTKGYMQNINIYACDNAGAQPSVNEQIQQAAAQAVAANQAKQNIPTQMGAGGQPVNQDDKLPF